MCVSEWGPLARAFVIDALASGYVGGNNVRGRVLVCVCACVYRGVMQCHQAAAGERWPALT